MMNLGIITIITEIYNMLCLNLLSFVLLISHRELFFLILQIFLASFWMWQIDRLKISIKISVEICSKKIPIKHQFY